MARNRYREDVDLMPEVAAARYRGASRFAFYLLIGIGVCIAGFVLWASQTRVDEMTKGDAKVIASRHNQIVQHLEGGIVENILVKEGDEVKAGQVLLRIINRDGRAEYLEQRTKYLALVARAHRLEAEAEGKKTLVFPKAVLRDAPLIARREQALYRSRAASFKAEIAVLRQQVKQRIQALAEQRSEVGALVSKVASLRTETQRMSRLVPHSVSRLEYLRKQREYHDAAGELRTAQLKIPRAQASIREGKQKITDRENSYKADIHKELNEVRSKISILSEKIQELWFKVSRTEVRSPVRGTIKQLRVTTKGGVVKAGEPLAEIVPIEDSLLIEARIRPSDRAFLQPGQTALVKITAYQYSKYGGLDGKVVDISADTIDDPARPGEAFYRVRVRTDKSFLEKDGKKFPIIPGMTAMVNIKSGKEKSILEYIFKPIIKATSVASR